MSNFNTTNPERLVYDNSLLSIEVLGGVRLEGLDRMRVTLKVSLNESEIPPLRHNLDLYNDTQLAGGVYFLGNIGGGYLGYKKASQISNEIAPDE